MRRLSLLILPIVSLIAACSSDEPAQPTPVKRVDIVTLDESTPKARFILDAPGSSGQKILVADKELWEEIDRGTRLLIEYEAQAADTALTQVPIQMLDFAPLLTYLIEPIPHEEITQLASGEATIISQWRTGSWINVRLSVAYNGTSRSIGAAADESTLNDEVVKCYIFNPGEPVGPNSVGRNTYASFFIGTLNLRPDQRVEFLVK